MTLLDSQSSSTWRIPSRVPGNWAGLVIFFAHTRSRVESVSANQVRTDAPAIGKTFILRWDSSDVAEVELSASYMGDPPVIRRIVWLVADGPTIALSTQALQSLPSYVSDGDVWPAAQAEQRAKDEDEPLDKQFERRERRILEEYEEAVRVAQERHDRRMFFHSFDKATMVETLPECELKDAIIAVKKRVAERVEQRARAVYEGDTTYKPSAQDNARIAKEAGIVSNHMLSLLRRFVRGVDKGWLECRQSEAFWRDRFDAIEFAETFDEFASGQLLVFDSHGAPNGTNFFFFAEAAFLFIDLQEREDFWIQTTETFVRATEIFVHSYWGGGCRRNADYSWENNFDGRFNYSRDLIDLSSAYAGRSQEALLKTFQATLAYALRDSFLAACPHG